MDFLLIIGVFEAFSLGLLLFLKKKRNASDSILASFFILLGINILLSYVELYNRKNGYPYPAFINTTAPLILLHGPTLWLYIQSQTKQNFKFKLIYFLHFIPFLGMLVDHCLQYYFLPAEIKIQIAINQSFKECFTYPIWVLIITISPLVYFSLGIRMLNNYNKKIENFLSHTERYDYRWLKQLLITITILYCLINFSFIIDIIYPLASFNVLQYIAFIMASLFVLFMGIFGHRQNNLFDSEIINVNLEDLSPSNKKKTEKDEMNNFIPKLQHFMQTEEPFLNENITLSALSEQLNVSTEFLSKTLNERLNIKFFDYINHFRVEKFKQEVEKPENKNLTLTGIASNCGFNSKATFYRVFKKIMNITPNLYKQELSKK